MTAQVVPVIEADAVQQTPTGAPGWLGLWCSSWLVYFVPQASRRWPRSSLGAAVAVAVVNSVAAAGWIFAGMAGVMAGVRTPRQGLAGAWADAAGLLHSAWHDAAMVDRIAIVAGLFFLVSAYYLMPFFVLLPFAARPGPNKPCLRHVLRTTLLSSGAAFLWGPALAGVAFGAAAMRSRPFDFLDISNDLIPAMLLAFGIVVLWTTAILIYAARRDYRGPADFPAPHDPFCDVCGYDLIAADMNGRCPECGTPVMESLGEGVRRPTPWECHPSPFRFGVVLRQLGRLVLHPRRLFASMPTLTGQRAAQRWLLLSMIPVGTLAGAIVPLLACVGVAGVDWSWRQAAGALAMAVVWTGLALMMVGIETAGVATFSRWRGRGVYLSTAAKVTAYAAPLMVLWVLLGGAQLITMVYFEDHGLFRHFRMSLRTEQIILAVSLSAAHIGGLLWYELTVYRGIRAVQFANR